jgi:putative cell wall-binding protein
VGDGPVLLTRPDTLPSATRAELDRLAPLDTIYLLGGTAAVSSQVESQLGAHADDVVRVSGSDRYATAAAFSSSFGRTGGTVYLATGADFADALVAGAAAGADAGSLLLTRPTSLPAATAAELSRIDPDRIIIVGGTAAVSDAVASAASVHGPVTRIAGANRYATAAAISSATFDGKVPVLVATGQDFPDAMVASAAAIAGGGPVLLTRTDGVPSSTADELGRLAPASSAVVGGAAVITDRASAQVYRSAQ